jgi:hypothetical protein
MRGAIGFVLGVLLGAGFTAAVAQQKVQDSTIVDPDVHKVALENEHVRVLDARIAPGWKSPMHSHPPMVIISLGSGRFRMKGPDGKAQIADFNPGMVLWRDATEHSWEMLSGDAHIIAVEVKSAAKMSGK